MVGISAGIQQLAARASACRLGRTGSPQVWMGGGCCAWSPHERPITRRPVWTHVDKLSRLSTAPTLLPHDSPQRTWMARGFSTAIPSRPTDVSTAPALLSARHPIDFPHRPHLIHTVIHSPVGRTGVRISRPWRPTYAHWRPLVHTFRRFIHDCGGVLLRGSARSQCGKVAR